MSKKISELSSAALPLSGQETVVMNQNGSTVTSALSNVKTYVGIQNTTFTSISTVDVKLNNSIILKGYNTNVMIGPVLAADQPGNYTMTGDNNILVGEDSGRSITSGDDNICIGKDSGNEITTGTSNVFIGRDSGSNITTAGSNVLVGVGAGQSCITSANTCIGQGAGYGFTSAIGVGSTHIGFMAGYGSSYAVGNYNTLIGFQAGHVGCPGEYTTGIGYLISPLHSNCIVLGAKATTTGNNQLVIGSTEYPLLTASGKTITGDFLHIRLNGVDRYLPLYA